MSRFLKSNANAYFKINYADNYKIMLICDKIHLISSFDTFFELDNRESQFCKFYGCYFDHSKYNILANYALGYKRIDEDIRNCAWDIMLGLDESTFL